MVKQKYQKGKDGADYVAMSMRYYTEADQARKPIRSTWDKMWNIYNNCYDFSDKAEWQSQSYIPKIPNTVRMASSILKRSLIRSKTFFRVDSDLPQYKAYAPAIHKDLEVWLRENKFVESFTEAVMMGMLTNLMIFKVFWRYDDLDIDMQGKAVSHDIGYDIIKDKSSAGVSPEQLALASMMPPPEGAAPGLAVPGLNIPMPKTRRGSLVIKPVNPYFFYLDPTGRNKYCFHVVILDLSDLKDRAKEMGYDPVEVAKIEESFSKQEWDYRESVRRGQSTSSDSNRKQVILYEFWGDVIDEEGNVTNKNCTWTIANEKYCIRKPTKNPNWHGLAPFAFCPIVKRPFSVYHKGYLEDVYGIANSITDLFNTLMDANSYAMAKAFEIDVDLVYDPDQLLTGVYPGKTLLKRSGGNPNARMVQEITLGSIQPQSLRIYQELDREFQNGTGLSEFLIGKPASRGRPTATEVVEKGAQALSIMEDIALDIEDGLFAPLLNLCYMTLLQYQTDFSDPRLQSLGDDVRMQLGAFQYLPAAERRKAIDAFKFYCRGMSAVVSKSQEMQKALSYATIVSQTPEEVRDRVDWKKWHQKILDGMNWDYEEILLSDEEYQMKLQIKQQMLQQQMAMRQQMMAQKEGVAAGAGAGAGAGGQPPMPPEAPPEGPQGPYPRMGGQ